MVRPEKIAPSFKPLEQFTPFGRFPIEIRNMIWERTIQPRDIIINNYNPRSDLGPATLQVCKESCLATVSHYKLVYQGNHSTDKSLFWWINFSIDRITYQPFSSAERLDGFEESISLFLEDMELRSSPWWMKHIQQLRVTVELTSPLLQDFTSTWRLLKKSCPDLQQISLLLPILSGREWSWTVLNSPSRTSDLLQRKASDWAEEAKLCTTVEMILKDAGKLDPRVDFKPEVWEPMIGGPKYNTYKVPNVRF